MARKCWLRCLSNMHMPILLKHGENYVAGRSTDTKIKDKRCSKNQVELLADYDSFAVTVRQIGANTSAVNGKALEFGNTRILKHNDIVEILQGQYLHKIEFEPPPVDPEQETVAKFGEKRDASAEDKQFSSKKVRTNGAGENNCWAEYFNGDLIIRNKSMEGRAKIAGFDMDGTLITTKSGKVFAENYDDWKILYSEVPGKLKSLYQDGYKIVIFTNQAGIGRGKQTVPGMQKKIDNITAKLGVPIEVLMSTGKGIYRKPNTGMWKFFCEEANDGVKIDMTQSVYVGDAAGRPAEGKKKKDFSSSDRLFALNTCLSFYTPEEFFLGVKTQDFNMPEFDPRKVSSTVDLYDPPSTKVPKHKVEVIILVGYPGSGKSFFCQNRLKEFGYVQANRDTLGTWQKCVSVMEKSVQDGKRVVIDNTNPDADSRKRYIDVAKKLNVPVRCFLFNVTKDHCRHNNKFREFSGEDHSKVNDMIFHSFKSKFQEPNLSEGFEDIVKVNFVPQFRSTKDEDMYKMFLLEK